MKKKILFATIALVTLLAFTGCDKILEFMFPDSTGGDQGWGENSIQVQVTVTDAALEWWNYDIYIELSEATETGAAPVADAYRVGRAAVPFDNPDATPSVSFRYDGLPDKTYSVRVWMDINAAFGADVEDPSTNAHTDLGLTSFMLPFYDLDGKKVNQVFVFAELQAPPPPIDSATPFVFVKGPGYVDINNPSVSFMLDTTAFSGNLDEVQWEIRDPGYNYLTGGTTNSGENYINVYVPVGTYGWYDGTYYLTIWDAMVDGNTVSAWQYDTPFKVIYPAYYNPYYADVSGYGFDSWPHYLDYTTYYPVRVEYYDGYGSMVWDQEDYTGVSYGSFFSSSAWDSVLISSYPDVVNAGKIRIFIDKDGNGSYDDDMDLAAEIYCGLDYWLYDYGGFYEPNFDANPARFIPVIDFYRMYGF